MGHGERRRGCTCATCIFLDAIKWKKYDEVRKCLASKDLNFFQRDEEYAQTGVHLASAQGNGKMLELLQSHKKFHQLVNSRDRKDNTPLHLAAQNCAGVGDLCCGSCGYHTVIRLLLESGANVNAQNQDLLSPAVCFLLQDGLRQWPACDVVACASLFIQAGARAGSLTVDTFSYLYETLILTTSVPLLKWLLQTSILSDPRHFTSVSHWQQRLGSGQLSRFLSTETVLTILRLDAACGGDEAWVRDVGHRFVQAMCAAWPGVSASQQEVDAVCTAIANGVEVGPALAHKCACAGLSLARDASSYGEAESLQQLCRRNIRHLLGWNLARKVWRLVEETRITQAAGEYLLMLGELSAERERWENIHP